MSHPVMTFPSVSAATTTTGTYSHGSMLTLPYSSYQPRRDYGVWAYTGETSKSHLNGHSYSSRLPQYSYNGYYRDSHSTSVTSNPCNDPASQYRAQLQWQRPYTGPRPGPNPSASGSLSTENPAHGADDDSTNQIDSDSRSSAWNFSSSLPCFSAPTTNVSNISNPMQSTPTDNSRASDPVEYSDLSSLPALQPAQIANILRTHPELRDAVWAAVDREKTSGSCFS